MMNTIEMERANHLANQVRNAKSEYEIACLCYAYWEDFHVRCAAADMAAVTDHNKEALEL